MERSVWASLPDIVCERVDARAVVTGMPHEWVWHSPGSVEWGYGGSGPADLALNIHLAATGDRDFAALQHQRFKRDVIAPLPASGGVIRAARVRESIERRCRNLRRYPGLSEPPDARILRGRKHYQLPSMVRAACGLKLTAPGTCSRLRTRRM